MKALKKKWIAFGIFPALIFAASGCGTIKHRYPVFPSPEAPSIAFQDTGDHCLNHAQLRHLTEYVIRLNGLAEKYRREIQIINGE